MLHDAPWIHFGQDLFGLVHDQIDAWVEQVEVLISYDAGDLMKKRNVRTRSAIKSVNGLFTSKILSLSTSRPVISISIHTRWLVAIFSAA